jgi:hypothetical protein
MSDDRYGEAITGSVFVCRDCGSIVLNQAKHDEFHSSLSRVADDAHWGGMNRPIGGGRNC